jgi:hypothetical protein
MERKIIRGRKRKGDKKRSGRGEEGEGVEREEERNIEKIENPNPIFKNHISFCLNLHI